MGLNMLITPLHGSFKLFLAWCVHLLHSENRNKCLRYKIDLFRTKPLCNHSLNSFFILLCHWANTLSRLMWMEWVIDIQKLKLIFATLFGTRSQNVFILFGTNERWGPFMKWHIWIPPVNSWSGKKVEEFHWHLRRFLLCLFQDVKST